MLRLSCRHSTLCRSRRILASPAAAADSIKNGLNFASAKNNAALSATETPLSTDDHASSVVSKHKQQPDRNNSFVAEHIEQKSRQGRRMRIIWAAGAMYTVFCLFFAVMLNEMDDEDLDRLVKRRTTEAHPADHAK